MVFGNAYQPTHQMKKPQFVEIANFYGVNLATMTNFKLSI
jgi:hypothetical protein